jgi:hypothetical protein
MPSQLDPNAQSFVPVEKSLEDTATRVGEKALEGEGGRKRRKTRKSRRKTLKKSRRHRKH